MKRLVFGAMVVLFAGSAAQAAGSHVCKMGNVERKVSVAYDQEGKKVPCSVKYKRADGDEKEIFKAANEEGYCEKKADEFVQKLSSTGWQCAEG